MVNSPLILSAILVLFLSLLSCGARHSKHRSYGKMTVADLVREKGQPLKEEAIPVEQGKILQYENDEKFQIRGDIVVNSFRQPTEEETTLLYWKNSFKDCVTEEKILRAAGHEPAELELVCKSRGIRVVYTDGAEVISRVIEYAPE